MNCQEAMEVPKQNLIDSNYQFAEKIALSICRTLQLPETIHEDVIQDAYLGLLDAVSKYSEKSEISFKTYAKIRIRGAVIDALRARSDLGRSAYKVKKIIQIWTDTEASQGLYKNGNNNSEELTKVLDYLSKGALVYRLNQTQVEEKIASIEDQAPNQEELLIKRENRDSLKKLIKQQLNKEEQKIIDYCYFQGKSQFELAHKLKVSKSWVSRTHKQAIEKLQKAYIYEQQIYN